MKSLLGLVSFLAIFVLVQGFATISWSRVASFIDFGNTHFHDDQMKTALCIIQYRFLKEMNELDDPSLAEPSYFQDCPIYQMVGLLHYWDAYWAHLNFVIGVVAPDNPFSSMHGNANYHFDAEQFQTANSQIFKHRQDILKMIKGEYNIFVNSFINIRYQIGIDLHAIQDFYAHSNWVEMGNNGIVPKLGVENSLANIPLQVANGDTCNECERSDMNKTEQEIYNASLTNWWRSRWDKIGCHLENVYVCRNNIKPGIGVTSGYYGGENVAKPNGGKCSHGGGADSSANSPAKGGISKDADTLFYAPHYYLHDPAAKLAVDATIQYFNDLRTSIEDDKRFGQLIGIKVPKSISIMIDTTGSMEDSIAAAKTAAINLVMQAANDSNLYYLTPINDPDYGPVYTFTNATDMVNLINTLTADGGGDTPEQQFPALLETVQNIRDGTNIYLFTDATSHHQELGPQIHNIATKKKISINFMMSGENTVFMDKSKAQLRQGAWPFSNDDSITTIEDYKLLALGTGGLYLLTNYANINATAKVVSQANWQSILFENFVASSSNFTWAFPVDDSINKVQIVLVSSDSSYIGNFNVSVIASGTDLVAQNNATLILSLSTILVYEFNVSDFSTWSLVINNLYSGVAFTVTIRAQSTLDPHMTIIDSNTGNELSGQPVSSSSYNFYFGCDLCSAINNVTLKTCQTNQLILPANGTILKLGSTNEWFIFNVTMPVSSQICIELTGTTLNSRPFRRLVQQKLFVSSVSIQINVFSNGSTEGTVFPDQNATLNYNVANLGTKDDIFGITVTSSNPSFILLVVNTSISVPKGASINGSVTILANGTIGDFSTIEISVASHNDPSITNIADFSLIIVDPNPDIWPPVCNITADTLNKCPSLDKCNTQGFVTNITFSDRGSGVSTVSYTAGNWTIPDLYEFTANSTYNTSEINFYAFGSISCCQNYTEFNIVDRVGNIGKCVFTVNAATIAPTTIASTTIAVPQTTTTTYNKASNYNLSVVLFILIVVFNFVVL